MKVEKKSDWSNRVEMSIHQSIREAIPAKGPFTTSHIIAKVAAQFPRDGRKYICKRVHQALGLNVNRVAWGIEFLGDGVYQRRRIYDAIYQI